MGDPKDKIPSKTDPIKSLMTLSITNQHRKDWNNFVDWMERKGVAGSPELDRGRTGEQYLKQFIKENPNTSLTLDVVKPLQAEFQNYRNWVIDQFKTGKAKAPEGAGVNYENFMSNLSPADNFLGQFTSKQRFPQRYLEVREGDEIVKRENKGFATVNK